MTAASPSSLIYDLSCCKCQYNLRSLSEDARCPECGTPVADSMQFQKNWGRLDFNRLFLGAFFIMLFPIPNLVIRAFRLITGVSSGTAFLTLIMAMAVVRALLLVTGVSFLVTSKKSVGRAVAMTAIGISAAIGLTWIAIQMLFLVLTLAGSPGLNSETVRIVVTLVNSGATVLHLLLLVGGWIFMHDFALRGRGPHFLLLTHIGFSLFLAGTLAQLLYYALLTVYTLGILPGSMVFLWLNVFDYVFYVTVASHFLYWLAATIFIRRMQRPAYLEA